MPRTLSDVLVDRLLKWGVDTIFGLPGDGINGLYEALRTRQDQIRLVQVRHEEAAAFAACGYAKFTGRLGVCLATSGPGGIHLLNGLYDAKIDGQPVLAITGHTFHDLIGTQYQQDVDLDKLFMDVAAFSVRVGGVEHVTSVLDQAVRTSLSRRTVTHLNIPKDIQSWTTSEDRISEGNVPGHSSAIAPDVRLLPPDNEIEAAAEILNRGKKVAILAGRGALGAQPQVVSVAETLGAPVIKALLGKAVLPDDSPLTTGGIGLLGTAPSYEVMKGCDTLLILGSNFPYLEFYPQPGDARCVQIDVEPGRIGLRFPADVGLVGDCQGILEALLPQLSRKEDRSFLENAQTQMKEWRALLAERGTSEESPIKPQFLANSINDFLDRDAIIVADCGTVTGWTARYVNIRDDMLFSSSGILASMANGIPYSVGAAMGHPGRQVVCCIGDGGLGMSLGELATLAKYQLPVKVIVFVNGSFGQIKWEQLALEGNPEYGCELHPIDFAACAKACGIPGYTVEDPAALKNVLREAFQQSGPAVVSVIVDPHEPQLPGHITLSQAWNFGKALARGQQDGWKILKTIVTDRFREVI